jgi:hypothetical protein
MATIALNLYTRNSTIKDEKKGNFSRTSIGRNIDKKLKKLCDSGNYDDSGDNDDMVIPDSYRNSYPGLYHCLNIIVTLSQILNLTKNLDESLQCIRDARMAWERGISDELSLLVREAARPFTIVR